MNNLKYPNISL